MTAADCICIHGNAVTPGCPYCDPVTPADHANTVREHLAVFPLSHPCHAALDALAAQAETAEAKIICPVCGGEEWTTDYDYNGEDEMQVDRCDNCQWPPTYPATVAEWKRRHFMSPYIKDMEEAVKTAEAERDVAVQAAEQAQAALQQIAEYGDASSRTSPEKDIARAALAGNQP